MLINNATFPSVYVMALKRVRIHHVRLMFLFIFFDVLSATKFNPEGLPAIVWWTDLLYPHVGGSAEITCPRGGRCVSSARRRKYRKEKMAFLFYGTDFHGEDLPLPRREGHVWALLHEESPMNNWLLCHPEGIRLFNVTATFSRHSHFPLPTQHLPSLGYLMRRGPLHTQAKNKLRTAQGLAPVLYLQSHCGVASDRDRYVGLLMRFLRVDSYGGCLHNADLPLHLRSTEDHHGQELLDFIARYKFHLAFENAICEDYVTEKLFRTFHVGSVPIYRGSSSVLDWAPSNMSMVMADDFSSTRELADFIKKLDANDELYNAYLTYKVEGISNEFLKGTLRDRTWSVDDPTDPGNAKDPTSTDFIRGFECHVCDQLCLGPVPSVANQRHMNCPPPHSSLRPGNQEGTEENVDSCRLHDNRKSQSSCEVPKEPATNEWSGEEWLEHYWFASQQAKAIALMLHSGEEDSSRFLHYLDNLPQ